MNEFHKSSSHIQIHAEELIFGEVEKLLDIKKGISTNFITSQTEKINLPESNVLKFCLEDNSWLAVRPSGTEPEIKFYFGAVADSKSNAQKRIEFLRQSVLELCDKILNS